MSQVWNWLWRFYDGMKSSYCGRFAPSPTGPLHAGSIVAALASWLDARAHGGKWLVRIEDVDAPRCVGSMSELILTQLAAVGLVPDEAPVYQSRRSAIYQDALTRLIDADRAYPCRCSRKEIELALAQQGQVRVHGAELVYPGTCREGPQGRAGTAWRLRTNLSDARAVVWQDRRLGSHFQNVEQAVGDFVLKRADGCFTYQLAAVVDDAAQGITDVVRGEDLADNSARQILLQRALNLPAPRYLHTPLVLAQNGEKLSKQNGAQALDTSHPVAVLADAAAALGLAESSGLRSSPLHEALAHCETQWRELYNLPRD